MFIYVLKSYSWHFELKLSTFCMRFEKKLIMKKKKINIHVYFTEKVETELLILDSFIFVRCKLVFETPHQDKKKEQRSNLSYAVWTHTEMAHTTRG